MLLNEAKEFVDDKVVQAVDVLAEQIVSTFEESFFLGCDAV
jgi:hypothetical protein